MNKIKVRRINVSRRFAPFNSVQEAKSCGCGEVHRCTVHDFKLDELHDLAQTFDPLTTSRSNAVKGSASGVILLNKNKDLVFRVRSSEPGGPTYTQLIRFYGVYKDWDTVSHIETRDELETYLKDSEIGVWCSDPSFQYWGPANNATRSGYNIITETRTPQEPNKKRKDDFVICKHLIAVLDHVEKNWGRVVDVYWRLIENAQHKKKK